MAPSAAIRWPTSLSPARADADTGRRNLWLKTRDRRGLGFDS